MNHNFILNGFQYRLRPVTVEDAFFIHALRTDSDLSRYINKVSDEIESQVTWIKEYLCRDGDYYFVVEDLYTGTSEGLVSVYDVSNASAEWGRWVVRKGSNCTLESAMLMYRFAFDTLKLQSVYCRTLKANTRVVSFHDSCGLRRSKILEDYANIDSVSYSAIEHILSEGEWLSVDTKLAKLAYRMSRIPSHGEISNGIT